MPRMRDPKVHSPPLLKLLIIALGGLAVAACSDSGSAGPDASPPDAFVPDAAIAPTFFTPRDDLGDSEAEFNPQDLGADEWDIFDAEGRYLGIVTMPDRFSPFSLRGDLLYGVWRDEFEVQYVKVLRITGL